MNEHLKFQGKGSLFIISAPSGTGKSTICKELIKEMPELVLSISYTTRQKRKGEQNGVDYFFISETEFEDKIKDNFFIEWVEVFGNKYGTSKEFITSAISDGKDVLLEIDVQGAKKIKKIFPEAITIFILPPSIEELRERMKKRNEDTEQEMEIRLKKARDEIMHSTFYDYIVINDDIKNAVDRIKSIIIAERHKQKRMKDIITKKFIHKKIYNF